MDTADLTAVGDDPRYRLLVRRRSRVTWTLTGIMLAAYCGFLLLIAFDKPLLARPIAGGVTSIGVVLGFAMILLAVGLTGLYVRLAATEFDPLVDALRRDTGQ